MSEPAHRISLGGALGLRDAESLRDQLMEALGTHMAVEIDTGELTELDLSIVQVFIAAHKTARQRGQSLRVVAPAEGPLRQAVSRGGLLTRTAAVPFEIHWQERDARS